MKESKRVTRKLKMVRQCKWLYLLVLLLASVLYGRAQEDAPDYSDSTMVDTVITQAEGEKVSEDTVQNFFDVKESMDQPYSPNKIDSRVPADKEVNAMKNEDDFWYVKSIEQFKSSPQTVNYDKATRDSLARKRKADGRQFSQEERYNINLPGWVGKLLWGVIVGVFLFAIVYFLLANKINIFSRSNSSNATATGDIEDVDLFNIPYQELLQKAYAEKNYRLAVRILYLQTLKLLSERNIIAFQADYTNMDYLQQLSQTMFYKDFFAITRHYEYVWYGGFTVSEPAFHTIQDDFSTIHNKILHR